jgi:hypothetical protein
MAVDSVAEIGGQRRARSRHQPGHGGCWAVSCWLLGAGVLVLSHLLDLFGLRFFSRSWTSE